MVLTVFGTNFRPAVPLLQGYTLTMVRSCFDFAPPLRAINKTAPIMLSNFAGIITNAIALALLVPKMGLGGAMIALVLASFADAAYLCISTKRLYEVPISQLLPWGAIAKVAVAATGAVLVILSPAWTRVLGVAGIVPAGVAYLAGFAVLLRMIGVHEGILLLRRLAMVGRPVTGFLRARCGFDK